MRKRSRGQGLAEFAIVFPIFMVIVGAIVQGGMWFWGQNTLTQVARDTVRWAASQTNCTDAPGVILKLNDVARNSSLVGYTVGEFTSANTTVTWPAMPPPNDTAPCPPVKASQTRVIHISVTHTVPSFFPFFTGTVTTDVESRVEPAP